jgi:hypothetical protein
MHDPDEIIARYGAAAGQRLIDAAEQGPAVLGELIQRHGIGCDYSVPGIIMAAHTEKALSAQARDQCPDANTPTKALAVTSGPFCTKVGAVRLRRR